MELAADTGGSREEAGWADRVSLWPAVVASLVLHGVLVVGFVWWGFGEGPGQPVEAEPVRVQVTFVPRNPQRREPELLPEEPVADPVPVPVVAVEELQPVVAPPDDSRSDLALNDSLVPDVAPDDSGLQDAAPPDENTRDLAEQRAIADEPGNVVELQPGTRQLENAIAGYMQGYRSSSVERWVDACRPSRPRAPDAPPCLDEQLTGDARRLQQQAWAAELFVTPQSRRAESERLFNQMVAESRYLETLTGDNTVLGQLARERFATLKENYCALNTTHRACSGDFADTISDVVTLISVGSP